MANVIYQSENMTVVDDREFLGFAEAVEILLSGESISVCDFPDYGAENEWDIYSHPFRVCLREALSEDTLLGWVSGCLDDKVVKAELVGYLSGYEISK